jgi:hypothetical protein
MRIINISEEEQNEFYDSERCHNGGGYHQPRITVDFDDGGRVVISDTSCGEFGSRVDVAYTRDGMKPAYCSYGSMYDEESSDFDVAEHWEVIMLVHNGTGYNIPMWDDIEVMLW